MRLLISCGLKVGAAFTMLPPASWWTNSRYASTCAESSFLPIWRAIMTVKVRPSWRSTDRTMARAACS